MHYRVADPVAFVRGPADAEPLLARLTESSLTRALSQRGSTPPSAESVPRSLATWRATSPERSHATGSAWPSWVSA